jgi:heme exporter protein B
MVSAIASRTGNNAALMAILGFPVVVPLLLLLVNASKLSLKSGLIPAEILQTISALFLIDVVVVILSVILFPYLWRD